MQILALGCKCLSGPMDWSDASLQSRIAPEIDPRNGHTLFELTDEAVPFRLLCYELYATIDSWAALDASLDNFDIEGPTDDVGMPLSPR